MASKARTSASRRKTTRGKTAASKASSKAGRSYKIGEVCRLLDIQPYVLNVWESEFPALEPTKSKSGQRSYSEADLEVIRRVKAMVYDEGLTLPAARQRLEAEGEETATETRASQPPDDGDETADESADETADEAADEAAVEPAKEPATKSPEPKAAETSPVPGAASGELEDEAQDGATQAADAADELDSQQAERIENLLRGVETALGQARDLLSTLQ